MIRKLTVQLVALSLIVVLSSADLMAQRRIKFRRGASSATLSGKIAANGYMEYVINGRAGQVMTIEIRSGNGAVVVNAGTATGKSFSVDMSGGDHLLSIVNPGRSGTSYTMTVAIN
jgi:hypothetical protein